MNYQNNKANYEKTSIKPLRHGGNLTDAIQAYGGSHNDWLDLSTGISPWSYPIASIDQSLWHTLPPKPAALISSASKYYNCDSANLTVTPGSQLAIRLIPTFVESKQTVAVPLIGYQEHEYAWQLAGHSVVRYRNKEELTNLVITNTVENVVIINPNNPSYEVYEAVQLRSLAKQLSGLLIIDEAFIDLDPRNSLSSDTGLKNIIVLRSIGKFFGLAGARIGFVITQNRIGEKITRLFDPWSISAPSQTIAEMALNDRDWQSRQRIKICSQTIVLNELLINLKHHSKLNYVHHCEGLFATLFGLRTTIEKIHSQLAQNKIWARLGDPYIDISSSNSRTMAPEQNWLRLSLPGDNFDRLAQTFNHIS